jgi:hypothetical protein
LPAELRRRFPGIPDTAQARECARTIASWQPQPLKARCAVGMQTGCLPNLKFL